MKYTFIISLFISIFFFTCEKRNKRCAFDFVIPVEVIPYSEEYRIGDTIMIKSKFSTLVWEEDLMEYINMDGVNWNPATKIFNMDTVGIVKADIKQDFDFIYNPAYDYNFFGSNKNIRGQYNIKNDSFDLEIKLIARKKGLFVLAHYCDIESLGIIEDHEAKCGGQDGYDSINNMNNGKDNNFHLLFESPEWHFNTFITSKADIRFHKAGRFCFRVVE